MRSLPLLVIAAAACAVPAAGPSAPVTGVPVFAVTGGIGDASISERDPRTLGQRGRGVPLGKWEFVHGLSPDGTLVALVAGNARPLSLRFLDVKRMRVGRALEIPYWSALRWIAPRRLAVLGEHPDGLRAAIVDAERVRIVRRVRIPGHLEPRSAEPTLAGTALLLRPLTFRNMGPVLVGVIRPSGAIRVVEVKRILSGHAQRARRPGLIADPSTSRAYVFGGLDEPVAEIDLRTMRVAYHTLRGPSPLSETLGVERFGACLAPDRIALGGWDDSKTETLRLGVSLVDTRTWRLRRIDADSDFFVKSGGLVLALRMNGSLGVYGLEGQRRFSVSEPVFSLGAVASNGRYVYAYNVAPGAKGSALVVDAGGSGAMSWPKPPLFGPVLSPGLVVRPGD